MYDYITIERTYGSGGHKIAEQLAKKLNYRIYDRSVVVETCKRMGLDYDVVSGMDEQNPVKTFFNAPGENLSMEEKIYKTEVDIIKEAAEQPGCIFVGRGASEILKDKKCLKVFITASEAYRRGRARDVEKIEENKIDETMKKFDKKREKFFTTHSGAKWGSIEYFDLIIDSEEISVDGAVAMLEALAKA
jgi:cytidylate kinase